MRTTTASFLLGLALPGAALAFHLPITMSAHRAPSAEVSY